VTVLVIAGLTTQLVAGPKGDLTVRGVAPGSIVVDGDFSDWPLDRFTKISQQPLAPEARIAFETDAEGDHLVYDPDRVGYFNGTNPSELVKDGPSDFGVANYFAHDGEFLYLLGVVIDSQPRGDRDTTVDGFSGFLNDGWEVFIDAKNDSDDDAAELNFPLFDIEEPNLDDVQITFALNDNFLAADAPANGLGARQHMERAGTAALMGPIDPDTGEQLKNAPDPGGNSYRAFLDAATEADGVPDISARVFEDLRAAGALNPEIADNPNETFFGYALESRIPFGILPDFEPDHNMGFSIFWRDFDEEGDEGGASLSWIDWTQNEGVPCDQDGFGLFCGFNWGELVFEEPPAGLRGDFDRDGSIGPGDLDLLGTQIASGGNDSAFDLSGDGSVDGSDRESLLGIANRLNGDADFSGDVQFADFLILSANFGMAGVWSEGDFDSSGDVQFSDFLILSANFGQSAPAAATVPESSSWSILFVGAIGLLVLRRR
jgi:hypothetical protein